MLGTAFRIRTSAAFLLIACLLATISYSPTSEPDATSVGVVVRATTDGVGRAVRSVVSFGGRLGRPLAIIGGFSATVPVDAIEQLELAPGVASVSLDQTLMPLASPTPVPGGPGKSGAPSTTPVVSGALSTVTRIVGAQDLWQAGYTGKGVDVAVIDTGVAPVAGLQADRIINGPDLSFDSQDGGPLSIDRYGHGTHMAGIIAGRDENAVADGTGCVTCFNASGYSDSTKFVGVAPESRIVNVKVGSYDGAADVSQVIAAIDWVVQHRNDNGMNIRVLNLSFGTDATQPYTIDPLAYAVEVAWRKGIFVVVAGGNDGSDVQTLTNPAIDPFILAVGASDPNGTLERDDDDVPEFASRGTETRHVDLVAPGVSILSLNVPGSYVATNYPTAVIGERFLRGSGTSEAAAVTSGVAALLLQKDPTVTPDVLKSALQSSARPMPGEPALYRGSGIVDAAATARGNLDRGARQPWKASTGTGSLEEARGSARVAIGDSVLTGEQDIFGSAWNGQRWSADTWAGTSWSGGTWNGQRWSGDAWSGTSWSGTEWTGSSWAGTSWSGQRWSGMVWDGQRWSGSGWEGQRWSGQRWSGQRWSGQRWSGQRWSSDVWS